MEPKVEDMENMEEMDRFLSVDFFHFVYFWNKTPEPPLKKGAITENVTFCHGLSCFF
jgi:hypothetical protein